MQQLFPVLLQMRWYLVLVNNKTTSNPSDSVISKDVGETAEFGGLLVMSDHAGETSLTAAHL